MAGNRYAHTRVLVVDVKREHAHAIALAHRRKVYISGVPWPPPPSVGTSYIVPPLPAVLSRPRTTSYSLPPAFCPSVSNLHSPPLALLGSDDPSPPPPTSTLCPRPPPYPTLAATSPLAKPPTPTASKSVVRLARFHAHAHACILLVPKSRDGGGGRRQRQRDHP